MTENVNGSLASSLVSPTTEKAIEDIINSEQQKQDTIVPKEQPQAPVAASEDNFENLQRAVQILGRAKQLDDAKRFDESLKMYRQGVDMLLEELMVRQGTDQSRSYLRNKCNDFMNRIDQLKLIIEIEKAQDKENQAKENSVA